jgi:hypothetical protein
MSSSEDRQRVMREIREKAAEVAITPDMPDDVSELALLDLGLDHEQAALQRLADEDPVGMVAFGDRDTWLDSRL